MNPRPVSILFGIAGCLAASLPAQTATKVLPDGFGYDQAAGMHPIGTYWSGSYARNMQLFSKKHTNITQAVLTEIQYRRAGSATFVANVKDVALRLGYSNQDPATMQTRFSAVPSAAMTEVFQGKVNLPFSASSPSLPPWAFGVKFTKPYVFTSNRGNLLVDIETSSVAATDWWSDAVLTQGDWSAGKTRELGEGCTSSNNTKLQTLIDRPHLAAPGRTMRALLANAPDKNSTSEGFAVHFLGLSKSKWGSINLPLALPTGCSIYTGIEVAQVVPLGKPIAGNRQGYAYWPIPANAAFANATLYHQWLMFDRGANSMDLIFSNGQEITIGAAGTFDYPTQSIYTTSKEDDHAYQSSFAFAAIIRLVGSTIR